MAAIRTATLTCGAHEGPWEYAYEDCLPDSRVFPVICNDCRKWRTVEVKGDYQKQRRGVPNAVGGWHWQIRWTLRGKPMSGVPPGWALQAI